MQTLRGVKRAACKGKPCEVQEDSLFIPPSAPCPGGRALVGPQDRVPWGEMTHKQSSSEEPTSNSDSNRLGFLSLSEQCLALRPMQLFHV